MRNFCLLAAVALAFSGRGASVPLPETLPPNSARVAEIASHLPAKPGLSAPPEAPGEEMAREMLAQPIPDCSDELYLLTKKTGNREKYQAVYYRRIKQLQAMSRAAKAYPDERFLKRTRELLEDVCAARSWVLPAHDLHLANFNGTGVTVDLGSSHLAYEVSAVLALLGDRLPASLRRRATEELERRVFGPYRTANAASASTSEFDRRGGACRWFFVRHNWSAVCHDYVIRAALAVLPNRRDRAAFVEGAERGMRCFLASFLGDGYCTEGLGYWDYGYGHFLELTRAVRAATGGHVDFSKLPTAKDAMTYVFAYRLDASHYPVFADGGGGRPTPRYLDLGCELWPDLGKLRDGALPSRTYFADPQVYIGRTPRLAFAIKGGNNGELHNHNDLGSWTLVADGREVAGDPGGEVYTARTFSRDRYLSEVLNSYGHPVPRVNGELQLCGREIAAEVVKREFADERDVFSLDLSAAYPATRGRKRALMRAVAFDRKVDAVTIADRLRMERPVAFESAVVTYEAECPLTPAASGGAWHLETKDIANPGRRTVHRHAVVFDAPLTNATVRWSFGRDNR